MQYSINIWLNQYVAYSCLQVQLVLIMEMCIGLYKIQQLVTHFCNLIIVNYIIRWTFAYASSKVTFLYQKLFDLQFYVAFPGVVKTFIWSSNLSSFMFELLLHNILYLYNNKTERFALYSRSWHTQPKQKKNWKKIKIIHKLKTWRQFTT